MVTVASKMARFEMETLLGNGEIVPKVLKEALTENIYLIRYALRGSLSCDFPPPGVDYGFAGGL